MIIVWDASMAFSIIVVVALGTMSVYLTNRDQKKRPL